MRFTCRQLETTRRYYGSGIVGYQDFWITGSRFYFQPDPIELTYGVFTPQPIFDFGRIDVVSPKVTPGVARLMDSDGGIRRLIAQQITEVIESYQIKCSNLSPNLLEVLFSANPGQTYTTTSTPIVSTQFAIPGRMVKTVDTNGALTYGLASITSVAKSPSTAMTQGVDWDVVSLERGLIKILPGSSILTTPGNVVITYVQRVQAAQTVGQQNRLIFPQTAGIVNGTGLIVWGRGNNMFQTVREAKFSVIPSGGNFSDTQYSDHSVEVTVLNDLTQPVPAGRLIYWLGDTIPTV